MCFFWGIKVSWCILEIWICQISSHFLILPTSIVYCSAYFLEGLSSFFSWLFLLCVAFYLLLHDEKFGSDSQKNKADKWGEEKLYNIKIVRLCLWIANPIIQRPRPEVTYPVRCTCPCFLNLRFHFIFHQGHRVCRFYLNFWSKASSLLLSKRLFATWCWFDLESTNINDTLINLTRYTPIYEHLL